MTPRTIHPFWLRLTHWINALAVILMMMSGWRIYNASPIWEFSIADGATLGGWLAGALQWHFAALWLLVLNGIFYLAMNICSGRFKDKFFPLSFSSVWRDMAASFRGKLKHDALNYNAVQKLLYLLALLDILLLVLSGLVLWKPVQFPLLRGLLGDYEISRRIHFIAMAWLCLFLIVHIMKALSLPRTLRAMIGGW